MKYQSTRDPSQQWYSFEEAICTGYAPDGGLFVPQQLPILANMKQTLREWSTYSYMELATDILRLFIDEKEISTKDLQTIMQQSFVGFSASSIVPVVRVGPIYVAELFHGPTFCFKDLGMRVVVNLLAYFATQRRRKVTLVVSTTGDTGPAAVQAVKDANSPWLGIVVHYPWGQISNFQQKQLTTAISSSVLVVAFQGGGDDMDIPIKRILNTNDVSNSNRMICGVNSYNIGRPLMQMVHYVR